MAAGSRYRESASGHLRTGRKLAPGYSLLQRLLQLLDRGAGENGPLVAQQIVRMHFLGQHQLHPIEVARTEQQRAAWLLATLDQQGGPLGIKLVQRRAIGLGLGISELQAIDYGQLAIGQLRGQRGAQGAEQLLAGKGVVIAARLGSVNRAAVAPERGAHRAYTSPSRTLLLPQLLACAGDQLLVLGGGRTLPHRGAIMLHRFPQQRLVDLVSRENLVRQLERAYLPSTEIHYINLCHMQF